MNNSTLFPDRETPSTGSPLESAKVPSHRRGLLPCLNSNISIENPFLKPSEALENKSSEHFNDHLKTVRKNPENILSTQHKKTAFILQESVHGLSQKFGINNIGFLTLTFSDHVLDPEEAQKRLNSLLSNVIKKRYLEYVGVYERQKSGRIHYHLLIVLDKDIRTGVDFGQLALKNYSSVPKNLRDEWAFWRVTAKNYRFGRTELLPVKSNIEAMSKYVGKYISKSIESRSEMDKGQRLVRYSQGARIGTTRFQFVSPGSFEWRRKLALFSVFLEMKNPELSIKTMSDISNQMGKSWAYRHRDIINDIDNVVSNFLEKNPLPPLQKT